MQEEILRGNGIEQLDRALLSSPTQEAPTQTGASSASIIESSAYLTKYGLSGIMAMT